MDASVDTSSINIPTSAAGRTLVTYGFPLNSPVHQLANRFCSGFRVRTLSAASPVSELTDASTLCRKDGRLDTAHIVAVVLNADAHGANGSLSSSSANDVSAATSQLENVLLLVRAIRECCPHAFIALWHVAAVEDAQLRLACFSAGGSMVTCFPAHLELVLGKLASIGSAGGPGSGSCSCAWCGQSGLTPDELWLHQPLHHIYDANRGGPCAACGRQADNLAVHIHEMHYPGGPQQDVRTGLGAAVVVHRRRDNKFLMVQEFAGQGYWVPGGGTDEGETVRDSAVRECLEEAGVLVDLVGVAEVYYQLLPGTRKPAWRMTVFYASLRDEAAAPKTVPCFESAGACWVGVEELERLPLRSPRIPCTWFPHFAAGGQAKPLELPPEVRHLFREGEF